MSSQHIPRRDKLTPRIPYPTRVEKRGVAIAFNFRDLRLTRHQQAWARSLTGSLGGWRERREFLQRLKNAQEQGEAEPEASDVEESEQNDTVGNNVQVDEAGEGSDTEDDDEEGEEEIKEEIEEEGEEEGEESDDDEDESIDDEGEDSDDDKDDGDEGQEEQEEGDVDWLGFQYEDENDIDLDSEEDEDPEPPTDPAEAWAQKAGLMHDAGSGDKQIEAWNPKTGTYIRNYALEARVAEMKAARKAAAAAAADSSDSESSSDEDPSDNSSDSEPSISASPRPGPASSPRSSPPPLAPNPAPAPAAAPAPSPAPPAAQADWRVNARKGVVKKNLSVGKEWSPLTWKQKSTILERWLVLEDDGVDIDTLRASKKMGSAEVTALIIARAKAKREEGEEGIEGNEAETSGAGQREDDKKANTGDRNRNKTDPRPPTHSPPKPQAPAQYTLEQQSKAPSPPSSPTTLPYSDVSLYVPGPSAPLKRRHPDEAEAEDEDESAATQRPYDPRKKRKTIHPTALDVQAENLEAATRKRLRRVFRSISGGVLDERIRSEPKSDRKARIVFGTSAAESQDLLISANGLRNIVAELRFLSGTPDAQADFAVWNQGEGDFGPRIAISTGPEDGEAVLSGPMMPLARLFRVLGEEELLGWSDGGEEWKWELSDVTMGVCRNVASLLEGSQRKEDGEVVVEVGVL